MQCLTHRKSTVNTWTVVGSWVGTFGEIQGEARRQEGREVDPSYLHELGGFNTFIFVFVILIL